MILVGTLVLPASMAPLFLMAWQPQVVLTVLIVPMVLAAMVAQVEPATLAVMVACRRRWSRLSWFPLRSRFPKLS